MSNFVIMTDSSCDTPLDIVRELELEVLPLSFLIDGQTYHNYPDNREMSPKEFYGKLKAGSLATTNAVNMNQALEAMEPILKSGADILVLAFASGLSATCSSFQMAAAELAPKYPERKLYVVDTQSATGAQSILILTAGRMRAAGKSIEEVRDWAEAYKMRAHHWVTVNDLFFLKKGGRVSAATAVVGTMLQIKPILYLDKNGKLQTPDKVRGRKGALEYIINKVGEYGEELDKYPVFVSHSDSEEEARWVADEIKKRFGAAEVYLNDIGPVIGAHTGPGCVVTCFLGKERPM